MSVGPLEIAVIVLIILLLFGATKLPELARSVGRSMRIFKSEVKEMNNDGNDSQQALPSSDQSANPASPRVNQNDLHNQQEPK